MGSSIEKFIIGKKNVGKKIEKKILQMHHVASFLDFPKRKSEAAVVKRNENELD